MGHNDTAIFGCFILPYQLKSEGGLAYTYNIHSDNTTEGHDFELWKGHELIDKSPTKPTSFITQSTQHITLSLLPHIAYVRTTVPGQLYMHKVMAKILQ